MSKKTSSFKLRPTELKKLTALLKQDLPLETITPQVQQLLNKADGSEENTKLNADR